MALTLKQQFDVANTATFKNLVAMAMSGIAADVMAENQSAMTGLDYNGVEEAQARTNLASRVISNAPQVADRARWILISAAADNLTWDTGTADEFAASIPDASYTAFIAANWSMLSGWRLDETP